MSEIVLYMDAPSIVIQGEGGIGMLQQGTKTIKERSWSQITATFLNASKVATAPTSARYRIDDITNGSKREILDWTAIGTPAATETVTITTAQNRILSEGSVRELRQVTVEATVSSGSFREAYQYEIINLAGTDNDT